MTEYAFPMAVKIDDERTGYQAGMTLRDWFAGQIVVKLLPPMETLADESDEQIRRAIKSVAGAAYSIADAMLEARK